ncbi:hypothetical protein AS156_04125 [Bradyrhizobium macuxiense]|uniref:Uncharacterized protein n=1 Tax=Bradyrhizobium macuxiense TaxID=1755647 RepID=A0A109JWV2_9BRAD|nr:hypothetical protein [Bradyrhizobium macuxiense]KWV56592.1 hypothetical protein AS156_04125 [Bradyrhizobium macuxiense]
MLPVLNVVTSSSPSVSRDWLGSWRSSTLAWWIPLAGLPAGLLAPVPLRAAVWSVALLWMGLACILNSRRCGRTHCRYTGPYYLSMIVPVLVIGFVVRSDGILPWIILGTGIVAGGKLIWWATERAWGRFS